MKDQEQEFLNSGDQPVYSDLELQDEINTGAQVAAALESIGAAIANHEQAAAGLNENVINSTTPGQPINLESHAATALGQQRLKLLEHLGFNDTDNSDEDASDESSCATSTHLRRGMSEALLQCSPSDLEETKPQRAAPQAGKNVPGFLCAGIPCEEEEGRHYKESKSLNQPVQVDDAAMGDAVEQSGRSQVGAIAVNPSGRIDDDANYTDTVHQEDHMSGSSRTCVTATLAEDMSVLEEEMRRRIMSEAVEASVVTLLTVPEASPEEALLAAADSAKGKQSAKAGLHRKKAVCILLLICFLGAVIGIGVALLTRSEKATKVIDDTIDGRDNPDITPPLSINSRSTFDVVRERGFVRCGMYEANFGFSSFNRSTGTHEGFNVDQCRAISLAVFGTPDNYEHVSVNPMNRFKMLAAASVDVLAQTVTHTLQRDIFEPFASAGFSFSRPYYYSGLSFGGIPDMVDCAEDLAGQNSSLVEEKCSELKICVMLGTTLRPIVEELIPNWVPLVTPVSHEDAMTKLVLGACNVFAAEPISLPKHTLRQLGYDGEFEHGQNVYSREPLSLVTNDSDQKWSALVDAVVNIFYFAEAENIYKANATVAFQNLYPSQIIGDGDTLDLTSMAIALVSEFGNYGEQYEKHLETSVPRHGLNTLFRSTENKAGLLYTLPFGKDTLGPSPDQGSTMETIIRRGYLRCGVQQHIGFAVKHNGGWSGYDVDFCQAIAAAIFGGTNDSMGNPTVVFEDLAGTASTFFSLINNDVDIVAGTRVSLQASIVEPSTGNAYVFSTPYYYSNTGDSFAMVTTSTDPKWSDFVNAVTMATIYAEEHGVSQASFAKMPLMNLFGADLNQMLQNAIQAVGSYAEIYDRNLQEHLPRSGANKLNGEVLGGSQQHSAPLY